jgi:flagellin
MRFAFSLVAIFLVASLRLGHAQDAVVNGGFEDSNTSFSPWILNDPDSFCSIGTDPLFSHDGQNHADLTDTPNTGSLTQTLNTVNGQFYTLSFWLANDGGPTGGDTNSFTAIWNGTTELSLTNSNPFNYTHFTYTVQATSSSTVLEFDFHNDADYFRLDTVSATAAVPEPSAAWLVLAGLPLFAMVTRRRAKSAR